MSQASAVDAHHEELHVAPQVLKESEPVRHRFGARAGAVVHRCRFNFLRESQIWYNRDPAQQLLSEEFENVIVLSDEFYTEVMAHPIPADIEVVKVFASAPAVLDLFMWLAYRRFRAMLEQWLAQVTVWGMFALP